MPTTRSCPQPEFTAFLRSPKLLSTVSQKVKIGGGDRIPRLQCLPAKAGWRAGNSRSPCELSPAARERRDCFRATRRRWRGPVTAYCGIPLKAVTISGGQPSLLFFAERVRFELTEPLRAQHISSVLLSATQPPFRLTY